MNRFASTLLLCGATISSLAANPVTVNFLAVNGESNGPDYISPYYGTIDGSSVNLYCDDDANEVSIGQTWQANLTTLGTGADLSNTRYGSFGLQDYQEIAWLTTQLTLPGNDTQNADIQDTIWNLFNPGTAPTPSTGSYWLTQAQTRYTDITNYSNFEVVTNVGPVLATGQVQEFITSTPEPSTVLLLGLGLAGLSAFNRRRSRTNKISKKN